MEDWHTYYVTEQGVLVHNDCPITNQGGSGAYQGDRKAKPWDHYTKKIKDESIDVSSWHRGSFDSVEESVARHYYVHADEVNASSIEQYIRKAKEFKSNLGGARKSYVDDAVEGVKRYKKNGKYIDLTPDGLIISFGASSE